MSNFIKNILMPSRKNKVLIIKERRNNTFREYRLEGKSSPADNIIELPNYQFFFEIYNDKKIFLENYNSFLPWIDRKNVIWRNQESDSTKPDFHKEYKKDKNASLGTVFNNKTAKKVVLENEYFRYYAKDYRIVLKYVNINKIEVIEELSPDKYIPPALGYKPDHIKKDNLSEEEGFEKNLSDPFEKLD